MFMMRKIRLYSIFLFLGWSIGSNAQLFDIAPRDAAKLPGRKLMVVLQEEQPEILNRIKKDPVKTQRYKDLVAYTNTILRRAVEHSWKNAGAIEYKTLKECLAIADTSQSYLTLEYTSFRQKENTQLNLLRPDTANLYTTRKELIRRKEYGNFDLKLIEKFRGGAVYTFVTPSSVPNEYDFITAVQFMSNLVTEKTENPKFSSRDYELKIQRANQKLFHRTLLADSNSVNKQGKSYEYIRSEYDSLCLYELSDPKGIVEKIYSGDTSYAYLNIIPYIDPIARGQSFLGTSGGNINDYEKTVYYMQLIFDATTGEVVYYDKAEENVVLVRDWKRFLKYTKEKVPFLQPKSGEAPVQEPQQKIYQNQYQQNQY